MEKRIANEIRLLVIKYPNEEINVKYKLGEQTIKFQNKTFILSKSYPFTKPKLLINDRPYYEILKTNSLKIMKLLIDYQGSDCICCTSVLCNWSPAITIDNILNEIDITNNLKRYIKYKLILQYLNFPNRISDNILSYLPDIKMIKNI